MFRLFVLMTTPRWLGAIGAENYRCNATFFFKFHVGTYLYVLFAKLSVYLLGLCNDV